MTGSYLDALRAELVGYDRHGRTDRADQVRAEIARIEGAARGRAAAAPDPAEPPQDRAAPEPEQTAPRRRRAR